MAEDKEAVQEALKEFQKHIEEHKNTKGYSFPLLSPRDRLVFGALCFEQANAFGRRIAEEHPSLKPALQEVLQIGQEQEDKLRRVTEQTPAGGKEWTRQRAHVLAKMMRAIEQAEGDVVKLWGESK
jgi:hypothetical protein